MAVGKCSSPLEC